MQDARSDRPSTRIQDAGSAHPPTHFGFWILDIGYWIFHPPAQEETADHADERRLSGPDFGHSTKAEASGLLPWSGNAETQRASRSLSTQVIGSQGRALRGGWAGRLPAFTISQCGEGISSIRSSEEGPIEVGWDRILDLASCILDLASCASCILHLASCIFDPSSCTGKGGQKSKIQDPKSQINLSTGASTPTPRVPVCQS